MTEEELNSGKALLIEINDLEARIVNIDEMIAAANVSPKFEIGIINGEKRVWFPCTSQEDFLDFLNGRKTALNTLKTTKETEFAAL